MKADDGTWVMDNPGKANLFVDAFSGKFHLPESFDNSFTLLPVNVVDRQLSIAVPEADKVAQVLASIDEESSTGPDLMPAKILKRCAIALSLPLWRLLCRIFASGQWPDAWMNHWVVPLHKRKGVWNPLNYRGIHYRGTH